MSQEFGLGRGLSSLIPQKKTDTSESVHVSTEHVAQKASLQSKKVQAVASVDAGDRVHTVKIADIIPNPHQPRLAFDKDKLTELAESIKEHGILQPPVVSQRADGGYELIAGERRFRAAQIAELGEVPVIVRTVSERQKMELALIENVQRHDLNIIEEAKAYQQLAHTYGLSQEDVAKRVGKSRSVVANRLRLLSLPITILKAVSDGIISEGHAKVIMSLDTTEAQHALFELIAREHLTVRQAEMRAKKALGADSVQSSRMRTRELPAITTAQKTLTEALDTRVKIAPRGRGGKIVIDYYAPEDLRTLVQKMQSHMKDSKE